MLGRKEVLIHKGRLSNYLFRFFPVKEEMIQVIRQAREMAKDPELDFTFQDFETVCQIMIAFSKSVTSEGVIL